MQIANQPVPISRFAIKKHYDTDLINVPLKFRSSEFSYISADFRPLTGQSGNKERPLLPFNTGMRLTDLLILYFSIGAPVLVTYLVTRKCTVSLSSVAYAVGVIVLWPYFGASLLLHKYGRRLSRLGLSDVSSSPSPDIERRLEIIRRSMEGLLRESHSPVELYGWRSEFDRYISISLALTDETASSTELELTKVVQHPDPDIAAACHRRKILSKLAYQRLEAREQFLSMTANLCTDDEELIDFERLLLSLAELLDDSSGVDEIRDRFGEARGQNAVIRDVSTVRTEIWQPQI